MGDFFQVRERQTTVGREVRAGITSFMAMAYIIFTNPGILSQAKVPFNGAVLATCLSAGLITIMMGLTTNYPMCLAAGMGLNAVVAFGIVGGMHQSWQTAMGVIVLEGFVVLLFSASPLRRVVMESIPLCLKNAIAVGIGLFITFIGLIDANLLASHPATLVTFGSFTHPVSVLALFGLFVTGVLVVRRVPGALLFGILATAIMGMLPIWHVPSGVGVVSEVMSGAAAKARWGALLPFPGRLAEIPRDWSTFFAFDLKGALTLRLLPLVFACFMTDFFDTMGTAIAVGAKAQYLDSEGRIPKLKPLLLVDSLGAIVGGAFGCSSNTCYIESTAGAAEGGRTGLTAVVCGLLFLASAFLAPVIAIIGGGVMITGMPGGEVVRHPVTASALIIVGFLMMDSIRSIDWSKAEEALPAFLIIVMTPLTFSITHGIGAGFICYVVWRVVAGRARDIHPFLWVVAALFVLVFIMPAIQAWVG